MSATLAIETSQRRGGVALQVDNNDVDTEWIDEQRRQGDDLMPAIDRMCARNNVKANDLQWIGVSIGPGGFTGLRVAVSTAKTLGYLHDLPLIAVPSALVVVNSSDVSGTTALVALASKQNVAWITRCTKQPSGNWTIDGTPGLCDASDLRLDGVDVVIGDEHLPDAMRQMSADKHVTVADPIFDPGVCHALAAAMFDAGETTDAWSLMPVYPREPEAVRLWEARQQARPEAK